jgi:hypothetical protein
VMWQRARDTLWLCLYVSFGFGLLMFWFGLSSLPHLFAV